jgi:hypothetical protein
MKTTNFNTFARTTEQHDGMYYVNIDRANQKARRAEQNKEFYAALHEVADFAANGLVTLIRLTPAILAITVVTCAAGLIYKLIAG